MANQFTNQQAANDAARVTRQAALETYRQRLIAADPDPTNYSFDYSERDGVDSNSDGLTWDVEIQQFTQVGADVGSLVTEAELTAALTNHPTDAELTTTLTDYVPQTQPINARVASYTLVAADIGKLVTMMVAGANTLSVPQDSAATIPIGSIVNVLQLGAGQTTVQAGAGATLRVSGLTAKARAQYSYMSVQKISANTWVVVGDLAAS